MKKKIQIITVSILIILMLIYGKEISKSVLQGLRLCGSTVIPSLFPIFVGAKLLTSLLQNAQLPPRFLRAWQRLFGVSGNCFYAFLFGILGGYPLGAAVISELFERKAISKRDAEHCMRFCNNSGPGFFAAVVGGAVLHSVRSGLLLYGIHVYSALFVGFLFRRSVSITSFPLKSGATASPFGALFIQAIQSTCTSMLQICGLILFFSILGTLAECMGIFQLIQYLPRVLPLADIAALLQGMFELTGGILLLEDSPNAFVLAAFLMGWGGFCVHFQAGSHWQRVGLSPRGYYSSKLIQGLFSAGLAWLIQEGSFLYGIFAGVLLLILLIILRKYRKHTGNSGEYAL